MNNKAMFFKTNMIFHNSYLCKLESCINSNNDLTEDQKKELSMPLYKFDEFSIKNRNKEFPEKIINPKIKMEVK